MSIVKTIAAAAIVGSFAAFPVYAQEAMPTQETRSDQPMSDTWITTKVKAELLASQKTSGLEVGVETVNGVVTLTGDVDTREEAESAVATAKSIQGVKSVSSQLRVAQD